MSTLQRRASACVRSRFASLNVLSISVQFCHQRTRIRAWTFCTCLRRQLAHRRPYFAPCTFGDPGFWLRHFAFMECLQIACDRMLHSRHNTARDAADANEMDAAFCVIFCHSDAAFSSKHSVQVCNSCMQKSVTTRTVDSGMNYFGQEVGIISIYYLSQYASLLC